MKGTKGPRSNFCSEDNPGVEIFLPKRGSLRFHGYKDSCCPDQNADFAMTASKRTSSVLLCFQPRPAMFKKAAARILLKELNDWQPFL